MRMKTYLPLTFSALLLASPPMWAQEADQPGQTSGAEATATAPSTTVSTAPVGPGSSGMGPGMMQGGSGTMGPEMMQGGSGTMGPGMMQGGTGTTGPGMMGGRGMPPQQQ